MKIGKAKSPGLAGVTPPRKTGDKDRPPGYKGTGRPSKYRPEYCQAIIDYFSAPVSWEPYLTPKGGMQIVPKNRLPTFERFGAELGVHHDNLQDWRKKYPEFGEAWVTALALQKAFLLELAAAGIGNNNMGLILKCNHGMKEEKEATPADNLANQLAELVGKMPS